MSPTVDPTFDNDMGQSRIWARQVVKAQRALGKKPPPVADLDAAILDIDIQDTMRGSSTITLTLHDPELVLLTGGFLDADADGRLDAIDVNYPEDTDFWWRLTQAGLDYEGTGTVTLTFMERAAAYLMAHQGPVKASRGKVTRAEFLKLLTNKIKANGGLRFRSAELKTEQPIEPLEVDATAAKKPAAKKAEKERKSSKAGGINGDEKITFKNWDGGSVTLSRGQLSNAETVLDEATKHTHDSLPLLALLEACIVEAPFFANPSDGDATSVGILQLLSTHYGGSVEARRDIPRVVRSFLLDGFTGAGGAIKLAKAGGRSSGQIAQAVQGSAHPTRYQAVQDGARQVLEAYGGASAGSSGAEAGSTTYRKAYHFQIGTTDNARETYWDGMNRLADEVRWPLFIDGRDVYFDPETRLIQQKPVLILRPDSPELVRFSGDWDARQIATEIEVTLLCRPFEFRAGQVFKLAGFGPFSTGSTAKLPGRWLVEEISRKRFELTSTFTLKQPERPANEPAPETATREADGGSDDGGGSTGPSDGRITTEGGAKGIVDQAARLAASVGGDGVYVGSNYRPGSTTSSGNRSDHASNDAGQAARDIGVRGIDLLVGPPSPKLDKGVVAIGQAFGKTYSGTSTIIDTFQWKGYRVQIIWRTPQYGGHMGHIHIGVRKG